MKKLFAALFLFVSLSFILVSPISTCAQEKLYTNAECTAKYNNTTAFPNEAERTKYINDCSACVTSTEVETDVYKRKYWEHTLITPRNGRITTSRVVTKCSNPPSRPFSASVDGESCETILGDNTDKLSECQTCLADTTKRYHITAGCIEVGDRAITAGSTVGGLKNNNRAVRGVTCGVPEVDLIGEESMEYAKCCNVNLNFEDEQLQVAQSVPKYFCLPEGLARAGGGLLGVLGDALDYVSQPIQFGVNVVTLDFKNALGNVGSFFLPDKVAKGLTGSGADELCLSSVPVKLLGVLYGALPLNRLEKFDQNAIGAQQDIAAQSLCKEGAMPTSFDPTDSSCRCEYDNSATNLCDRYLGDSNEHGSCVSCAGQGGMWTALGCIKTDYTGFSNSLLAMGISIGGGVAFLCILYAAYMLQSSRGNPERIKKAREYLTSCIIGLVLILLSVLILRLVGVNILGLPGFE